MDSLVAIHIASFNGARMVRAADCIPVEYLMNRANEIVPVQILSWVWQESSLTFGKHGDGPDRFRWIGQCTMKDLDELLDHKRDSVLQK
jgi:hypothetical protein